MSGHRSHRVALALAYLLRTGCTATVAAKRFKVSRQQVNRARHADGHPVAGPGRPRKAAPIGSLGVDSSAKDEQRAVQHLRDILSEPAKA